MNCLNVLKNIRNVQNNIRTFSCSHVVTAGARWRESQQQERHTNATRCFADTADYSLLDGRPAPLNSGQKVRYEQQIKYNMDIQRMLSEMDGAVQLEQERLAEAEMTKNQIINSKLRTKGAAKYYEQLAAQRQQQKANAKNEKEKVLKGKIV